MTAKILDGKVAARQVREELAEKVRELTARGRTPRLVVVLVGDDPASRVYVRNKGKAARKVGIDAETREIRADVPQAELEALVEELGRDASVHGILVQLPLPDGLDAERVVRRIPPEKDVDGLHPVNLGKLVLQEEGPVPCTPAGIVAMLDHYGLSVSGKEVVAAADAAGLAMVFTGERHFRH